jgi:endonuclease/exonuclease/phosphatase family metal-dependent hydrolase
MRLLTYNIHKGIGGRDRRYRLERIMDAIEAENPDLVCLQEVDRNVRRSRFDNQPRLLADRLCAETRLYQLNVSLKRGGYGNLLISRWPLVEKHQISLRLRNKKPRGAQLALIDSPEGQLQLVNWHLGLAERERHWQAKHLLSHHLFQNAVELPTIIAGDTNDWRNTLANGHFATHGFRHITAPVSRFRTFPAYMPVGSLDKIFFRGSIELHRVRAVRSQLTRSASDHLPVVVDFHLA